MKRILVTGANSYVGTSVEEYLAKWPNQYKVDTLDMTDSIWRDKDFSSYDTVFHVAGIAHQDAGRVSEERKKLYYQVNRDLTIETAQKAKNEGVRQFVFMSSFSVYGVSARIGQTRVITPETPTAPNGAYGESKLQAEEGILLMGSPVFGVCVFRPPMIYGPHCKGNYTHLVSAALRLPFFPDIQNERSMLYIGNLCVYVKKAIDVGMTGIHVPQNQEYVCTSEMVKQIAAAHGKRIALTKVFNPLLRLLSGKVGVIDKIFGNMVFKLTGERLDGAVVLEESIILTEMSTSGE